MPVANGEHENYPVKIKFNNNHVYEDKLNHAHNQQKGNVATCCQMITVEISINFTYFFLYNYQNFCFDFTNG